MSDDVAEVGGDLLDWQRIGPEYGRAAGEGLGAYIRSCVRAELWDMLGDVSGRRVLDVGCGEGWLAAELVAAGASVTGVDGSATLLAQAAQSCPRARLIEHDLTSGLPAFEERFDVAVASLVLMDLSDLDPLLRDVARVLLPAGRLLFAILHPCFFNYQWATDPVSGRPVPTTAARLRGTDRTRPHHPELMRRRDVGRFDDWSESYDRSRLQRLIFDPVQAHIVDVSSRQEPSPSTILDVGCGTGRLLERLRDAYPTATLLGVDAAEGMVRVAARRLGVGATVAAAEALPFASGSVDLVVTTMSFHHWADQRGGLAEVRRVLAPGGRLLLADGIVTWWLRPFFALARVRSRMHTARELDAMFIEAGLQPAGRSSVPGLRGGVAVSVAVNSA